MDVSSAAASSETSEKTEVREPWFVVVCCVLGTAVGGTAIVSFGLGGYLKDIVSDLNWTRSGASNAISLLLLGMGFSAWLYGILIDLIGPKRVAVVSVVLLSVMLAVLSTVQSPAMMLALCLVLGLAAGATTSVPYQVVIASRFHRRRGLALGLGATGSGVGGIVLPYIVSYTATQYDWRIGLVILAGFVALIAVPSALIGLSLPDRKAQRKACEAKLSGGSVWRSKSFWLIAGALSIATLGLYGAAVQAVPLLTDRAIDRNAAAGIVSSMAFAGIIGRVLCGFLMDRFFAPHISAAFFIAAAIGIALIALTNDVPPLWLGFSLIGLTLGAETDMAGYLSSRYLRREQLGRAIGLLSAGIAIAGAVSVSILGYSYDLLKSYSGGIVMLLVLCPVAAFMMTRLGPYADQNAKPEQ